MSDKGFLTNKYLFLKKIKSSNYFIWKCVLIILPIKCVFIRSILSINEQSTMTVTGYVCIYSLLLSVAVVSVPGLYPLYFFYLVSRFTVKGENNFVATLMRQEF